MLAIVKHTQIFACREALLEIHSPPAGCLTRPADRHGVVEQRHRDHVGHVRPRASPPCSKSIRMTTRRTVGRLTSSKTGRAPTCTSPQVISLPGWVIIG